MVGGVQPIGLGWVLGIMSTHVVMFQLWAMYRDEVIEACLSHLGVTGLEGLHSQPKFHLIRCAFPEAGQTGTAVEQVLGE